MLVLSKNWKFFSIVLHLTVFFNSVFEALRRTIYIGEGKLCPGKFTLGKNFGIPGQYFYKGFKPRDRIFPTVLKKSLISSCLAFRAECSFYPS